MEMRSMCWYNKLAEQIDYDFDSMIPFENILIDLLIRRRGWDRKWDRFIFVWTLAQKDQFSNNIDILEVVF